jgi:nicotinate-nucleotide adenylyltransferase
LPERIGILGGTFDPIHNGHLALARSAREQLRLDRLIYVPAGVPWRKAGREITPARQRLAMVRLAVADDPSTEVSTIETERQGPSYTVDTLQTLKQQNPGAELYFIVGEDALADLPNWREPERIIAFATLAVARRSGSAAADQPWRSVSQIETRIVWLDMDPLAVSASDIRRRIAAGEPVDGMLPAAAEAYARKQGLYERNVKRR